MTPFGIDIGGTAIKSGQVERHEAGCRLAGAMGRVGTPARSTPDVVASALDAILAGAGVGADEPIGVAMPGALRRGVMLAVNNLDTSWVGVDVPRFLGERLGRTITVLNDADAAAVAEFAAGPGSGRNLFVTFGTGVGGALVVDGELVEGLEPGEAVVDGVKLDRLGSARHAEVEGWAAWGRRAERVIETLVRLHHPDRVVIGGGASEMWEAWGPALSIAVPVQRAALGNTAGVIGAAIGAARARELAGWSP